MTEDDVLQLVLEVLADYVTNGVEPTSECSLTSDLELDSMAIVGVLLQLEGRLGLTLSAADIAFDQIETPRTLAAAISTIEG